MPHKACPAEFQGRLTRAGGTNQYGEPRFRLVWGPGERVQVGGYFPKDGFVGYRNMPLVGEGTWCLVMWEPAELYGTEARWYRDYRDETTGLCDLGRYPHHGRYRLIQKLIHHEKVGDGWVTTRMEPNSFIIDTMLPFVRYWTRLAGEAKVAAIEQELKLKQDEYMQMAKDSRESHRVKRSSALVQKKIEFLERNMRKAMRIASHTQLGMRQAKA